MASMVIVVGVAAVLAVVVEVLAVVVAVVTIMIAIVEMILFSRSLFSTQPNPPMTSL